MVFFVVFVVARAAAALLEERGWFVVGVVLTNDDWFEMSLRMSSSIAAVSSAHWTFVAMTPEAPRFAQPLT